MQKAIAIFVLLALGGCTSGMIRITSPREGVVVATLKVNAQQAVTDGIVMPRIYSINRSVYPLDSQDRIAILKPGKHRVGVNCTSRTVVGQEPSFVFKFEVAKKYVIRCNGEVPELHAIGSFPEPP